MKLKSFAYLKKTGTCSDKETIQGKEPKQEEETFFEKNKTVKRSFNNFYFCGGGFGGGWWRLVEVDVH